ncbi:MAG: hypothetical protein K6E38_05475, partial [Fretibacterium sp.]|nr:hypothetical protein [Fretibacterium sp.]
PEEGPAVRNRPAEKRRTGESFRWHAVRTAPITRMLEALREDCDPESSRSRELLRPAGLPVPRDG